jgi:hypothetical protein
MVSVSAVIVKDPFSADRHRAVLLVDGKVLEPFLSFCRELNFSVKVEQNYAHAVALFIEWLSKKAAQFSEEKDRSLIFTAFAHDLVYGTIKEDNDPTGLWWQKTSDRVARRTMTRFLSFADWLSQRFGTRNLNPTDREPTWDERIQFYRQYEYRRAGSMMKHLFTRSYAIEGLNEPVHRFQMPGQVLTVTPEVPVFPTERIKDLLWEGFRNLGIRAGESRPWVKWNLRNILFTMILLFGGKRESEPCHLWVDDVFEDPVNPGRALVLIHEPRSGKYTYTDPVTNRKTTTTRTDYLMRFCGGRKPLTEETGRRRAGWKGNLLQDKTRLAMRVFWLAPDMGYLFYDLWHLYIRYCRPVVQHNPYAFLTEDGEPMGAAAYADSFKRAVERIGLVHSKSLGTTPHGLRHWYGQQIESLKLDKKVGQLIFAHRSALSQEVYRQMTTADVSNIIDQAMKGKSLGDFRLPNLLLLGSAK